jgi:hypothetical protein
MGLDMYLTRELYVGNNFRAKRGEPLLTVGGNLTEGLSNQPLLIKNERITSITEQVGYWRKANAIHAWFVKNVQDGVDNCQTASVSRSQLAELLTICKQIIGKAIDISGLNEELAGTLLPTAEGFFFGSSDFNDWYFSSLENTISIIEEILAIPESQDCGAYYYRASW